MSIKSPETEFGKAVLAFQGKDYLKAKSLCKRLLRKRLLVADVCHLLALIHKIEGDVSTSREYFEKSILAKPRQAVVLSNYANLLVQERDHSRADELYRRATEIDSEQRDAWYNWASLLNAMSRFDEAVEKIDRAIELSPQDARNYIVRGIALREKEDYASAVAAFESARGLVGQTSPLGVAAARELAIAYRSMNMPVKAIAVTGSLIEKKVKTPELHFLKACSHYDSGEYSLAEAEMFSAIDLRPEYVEAHEALNKLYWEQGNDQGFLESYELGIKRAPTSRELRYSLFKQLLNSGRKNDAEKVLQGAIDEIGPDADFIHALGVLSLREKRFDEAASQLNRAVGLVPLSTRFLLDRANLSIQIGDYESAFEDLEIAGNVEPLDQEVWAYKGLCWRLAGDDRAAWLHDYERLIDVRYLAVPEGYDNLEHFMHELRSVLSSLHKTIRQPLDQSVRNGTQTVGRLLSMPDKVIQDYRRVLTLSVKEYIDGLPEDTSHPFLSRRKHDFVHSGSWSVRLGRGGFHSNHMHPQGWLSNCTYVTIPGEIREDDPLREGWIKFGETSLDLGEREEVGRVFCPREGIRVLFPSFMWHGTFPFNSDGYRMTAPSDIMPAP